MAFNRATSPIYAKGTMDVWCFNPSTGTLDYYSNKIQTNQFTTSVNMGAINAGVGNPVVINLPDTSQVNLTLTAADLSLEARALSTGGNLTYNGIIPVMESITASGTALQVSGLPVAAYGMDKPYAYIDKGGEAYEVDPDTGLISGFTAVDKQSYCVRYFSNAASAKELTLSTVFAPAVEVVYMRIPCYSAQGSTANQGSKCGDLYVWVPRMQFSGNAATDGSQTTAATTDISGSALSYDAAVQAGVCEESAMTALAYMVYMPLGGATVSVEGLAIVGGEISLKVGEVVQTPVKYVIDGHLVQPDYSDLTYVVTATATATVDANGAITGAAAGSTEITVSLADPALSVVANLVVTSA